MFEIFCENKEIESKALCAGGRYDGLAKYLDKKLKIDMPASGWAAGIDRIAQVMIDIGVKIKDRKRICIV